MIRVTKSSSGKYYGYKMNSSDTLQDISKQEIDNIDCYIQELTPVILGLSYR